MQKIANNSRTVRSSQSERAWHPDEIAELRAWYPKGGYGLLAKKLPNRTKSSVYSMAHSLDLRIRKPAKPFQPVDSGQIAIGLGVSEESVIKWIKNGDLDARLKDGRYLVTAAALRRWIAVHHARLDLALVNRDWFIALAFPVGQD